MEEDLQTYIYDHIPIVGKNGFSIEIVNSPYVKVSGRFADHINHRNSVFGGSLSTALILSSWATVRQILKTRGIENGVIVIQSQTVDFDKPVIEDFFANVTPIPEDKLHKFIAMLAKFGKARLKVESLVTQGASKEPLARFIGSFVVLKS
jgi:thioesterase domain-containing protein